MSRYIDADKLIKFFPDDEEGNWTYNVAAQSYINIQPTIDLVERKQGEWIIEEEGAYSNSLYTAYCSNCRHYVKWFEDEYEKTVIRELPHYCSNCGSDMRKILPKL